jgi:soluble lytic murein transglycosylase-like protein
MRASTAVHAACMLVLAASLTASKRAFSETGPTPPSFSSSTLSAWVVAATHYRIDLLDLYAIALQESRRRRPDGRMRPWPWTLNSPRSGPLYFDTYEAAVTKLNALIAQGERNIDVGMMGINWYFNGRRARDPAMLLNVSDNIFIAAQIYREHLDRFDGDRRKAIAHYHSATPALGAPYATAVLTIADRLRTLNGVHLALEQSSSQNP